MTPEERTSLLARRAADERVLIYRNLLSGIPVWKVMEVFRKSEKEVMDIFRLVTQRLEEYCFQRKMSPLFCDCIATAQRLKMTLLPLLTKINLDKPTGVGKMIKTRLPNGVASDIVMDLLHEHVRKEA